MDISVIKGGRHVLNQHGTVKKVFAACVCPNCTHITKLVYDIKIVENSEIIVPFIERKKLEKCPICSKKLLLEGNFFTCGEELESEKIITDTLNTLRKIDIEKFTAEANNIIERSELGDTFEPQIENIDAIKEDIKNLKTYLKYAVKVESAVRFYQEHLINLKLELLDNESEFILNIAKQKNQQKNDEASNKKKIAKLEAKIQEIESNFENTDFTTDIKISKIKKPSEPSYISIPNISEPIYPELKKAGLFNKKKIEEENTALIARYNAQREFYLAQCEKIIEIEKENADLKAKYEKKLSEYKEKQKQQKLELQESAELLKEDARKEKEIEIAKIREEISNLSKKKSVKKSVNNASLFIQNDIKAAEAQLAMAAKSRADFYSYNIIYPKYRNYVAVATFCEYIDSGRCNSLEGPNGAYNLYETECMNNLIVSQLTVIADKLEDIKQNQILMYRELKTINHNLKTLNDTMKDAVSSIKSVAMSMSEMQDYLIDISANTRDIKDTNVKIATNTAIAAHYSEVTAHYTKLNCELTDALGFMVAFK